MKKMLVMRRTPRNDFLITMKKALLQTRSTGQ